MDGVDSKHHYSLHAGYPVLDQHPIQEKSLEILANISSSTFPCPPHPTPFPFKKKIDVPTQ